MRYLLCLLLLVLPAAASAQTHPCDAFGPQPSVPLGAVSLDMCWNKLDQAGKPTTATGYGIIIDGGNVQPVTMVQTTPTASTTGLYLFSAPYTINTPGNHTVIFQITTTGGTSQSAPLALQVQAAVPSPPSVPAPVRISPSLSRR